MQKQRNFTIYNLIFWGTNKLFNFEKSNFRAVDKKKLWAA